MSLRHFALGALISAVLLSSLPAAAAPVVVEDFEHVSDWSGLTAESSVVKQGSGAGRWADTVAVTAISKPFSPALDLSGADHIGIWIHAEKANGAKLQLVFSSENSATSGADYYSRAITIDWSGWRWLWLAKDMLGTSREPLGWNHIDRISLNASGWSHTPKADTNLVLDYLVGANALLKHVTPHQGWKNAEFIYDFDLLMGATAGSSATADVSCVVPGLTCDVQPAHVTLAAGGSAHAHAKIVMDAAYLAGKTPYQPVNVSIGVSSGSTGQETWDSTVAIPADYQSPPRTLLNAADFTRIAAWRKSQSWAESRAAGIEKRAHDWKTRFQNKYGVSSVTLPPEGGQWSMHYVCPTHGVNLHYEPPMTHRCPVDGKVYHGWPYDQVIYNRQHGDLASDALDNGLAYQFTHDNAYAAAAADILKRYADKYPTYPVHDKNGKAGASGGKVLSQTLDESGWAIKMAWAYDLISASGTLTAAEQQHIENDLLRKAATLIKGYDAGKSNWQVWHNAAMATVGRAIGDPGLVAHALHGPSGFDLHMTSSVQSDGFWYEGSWGYHFFTLTPMIYLAELGERGGFPLFPKTPLQKMFTAPVLFSMPNMSLPAFNDAHEVDLSSSAKWQMDVGYRAYSDPHLALPIIGQSRSDTSLYWGKESLPTTSPGPVTQSVVFQESGFAILRNGSTSDPWYLALDFGPHGGWHGHFDKLGFVFYARGQVMALDPGSHSYALPLHDSWDRSTVAHNTVVADEQTQLPATGSLAQFVSLPGLAYARAGAGDVYPNADLTRSVVMAPGYLLDRFEARAKDNKDHKFDWLVHNPASFAKTSVSLSPYHGFPGKSGYQHLSNNRAGATDKDVTSRFVSSSASDLNSRTWANNSKAKVSFAASQDDHHGGDWAGKITYDFSGVSGSAYAMFRTASLSKLTSAPSQVAAWIKGDGSNNAVRFRIIDATGESHVSPKTKLDFSTWKKLSEDVKASWSHWNGNNDGVIDLPLQSFVLEVSRESGGSDKGTLFIDDWDGTFPGSGTTVVDDFEVMIAAERLWAKGAPGSTYVFGDGIGPDLNNPVPYEMIRRVGQQVDFDVVHEPFGASGPVIEDVQVLGASGKTAQGYRISTNTFDDLLLIAKDPGQHDMGTASTDAVIAWTRRNKSSDNLTRLALAHGGQLSDNGVVQFESKVATMNQVAFELEGTSVRVTAVDGELKGARLRAPGTTDVTAGGTPVAFHMDGDYVVFEQSPENPNPDGGVWDGGSSDAGEGGAGGSGSAGTAGQDASAGTPDGDAGGSPGCDCATANKRSSGQSRGSWWWLTVMAGAAWMFRRHRWAR